jgi:hypothetical protein
MLSRPADRSFFAFLVLITLEEGIACIDKAPQVTVHLVEWYPGSVHQGCFYYTTAITRMYSDANDAPIDLPPHAQ